MAAGLLCACGVGTLDVEVETHPVSWDELLRLAHYEGEETDIWVANGDEPFDGIAALRRFYDERLSRPESAQTQQELAVYRVGGRDVVWSREARRNLSYCVSTRFGTRYRTVVDAMKNAAASWEAAANVDFVHVSKHDANCTRANTSVVFDVNPVNARGAYLARAFFPNAPRRSRNILIDGSSFGGTPSLTGILRHELGHVLGFRHEHTRPEAGACFEDGLWRPLTSYDPFSVMHYPSCNGKGDWSLVLSAKDKAGARALYP